MMNYAKALHKAHELFKYKPEKTKEKIFVWKLLRYIEKLENENRELKKERLL